MNKDVYLIYPSSETADFMVSPIQEYRFVRKPSLGLLYLATCLDKHGLKSRIFDQTVDNFSYDSIAYKIKDSSPLFVGIYSDSALKPNVLSLITAIKTRSPNTKVVIGGPAYFEYEDFHKVGAEIVCHGEGEITICDIADHYLYRKELSKIKGISYIENDKVIKNNPRELIENLDTIPLPDRRKLQLDKYYDYHIFGMKQPYAAVITSRGCPYRCSFCSSGHSKYRLRSVPNVIAELDELINKYKVRYVGFKDDLFGFNMDWVRDFAHQMKRNKLKVSFSCMLHPFSFKGKRHEMLSLLKEIGLDIIVPGLQSVDNDILKNINRNPKEPQYLAELISEAKKLSITTVMEFIFGLPGDTPESFKKSFNFAQKVKPNYALFYSLSKLPGTELCEEYSCRNTTNLTDEYIRNAARNYQKQYFLSPNILIQNFFHVLRKNPAWFLHAIRHTPYLIRAAGIRK